ncbi:hypothetical protein AB0D27_06470 [Streptomyces sp. NPDC048415]|uniref:hypothetical protein n=1 Tax=Streptomyces sp. NPDC048415 TaxID=3154822 RepID=UPI003441BC75
MRIRVSPSADGRRESSGALVAVFLDVMAMSARYVFDEPGVGPMMPLFESTPTAGIFLLRAARIARWERRLTRTRRMSVANGCTKSETPLHDLCHWGNT